MASTKYTYSLSADFLNQKIAIDRLTQEIQSSDIVIAIDYLNVSGDTVDIWFKDVLSAPDQSILDNLVSVHTGEPLPSPETDNGIPIFTLESKQADDVPKFALSPRVGSETVVGTHNFCDKTSWFGDSIRVEDQTLEAKNDGYNWGSTDSDHINWIDLVTGRIHNQEKWIAEVDHGYSVVIKVDGIEKTLCSPFTFDAGNGDYWVDYDKGEINFFEDMTGKTITASFNYAQGSNFYIKPKAGKILLVEDAETDFSKDCILNAKFGYIVVGFVDVFAPQYMRGSNDLGYANSIATLDPPSFPNVGDTYIIGGVGTGDWTGYDGAVVQWDGYTWGLTVPQEEDWLTVIDMGMYFTFRDSTWNPTPYPSGTKIPLQEDYYYRVAQIITEARGALPPVTAIGASEEHKQITDIKEFRRKSRGMKTDVQAVPFNYSTARELRSSYGMELWVNTGNDVCIEGEMLTITFYCSSVDES